MFKPIVLLALPASAIGGTAISSLGFATLIVGNCINCFGQSTLESWTFGYLIGILAGAPLALATTVTLGAAWHVCASKFGWTSVLSYALPGACTGLAATMFIVGARAAPDLLSSYPHFLLHGIATGGLTGIFFWLIRRPDRDAQPINVGV